MNIDDVSSILDDFIILSFIIQLSVKDMTYEQRNKIINKIDELHASLKNS